MEHKTLHEIDQVAERLSPGLALGLSSRQERLDHWAKLLERLGSTPITALIQIEYLPIGDRAGVRADNSPLAVAYGDPSLRLAGLGGDTYGDIKSFFDLSDQEAHYLLCDCHYHGTMTAGTVAMRIQWMNRSRTTGAPSATFGYFA